MALHRENPLGLALSAIGLALAAGASLMAPQVEARPGYRAIQFERGESSATISDAIRGQGRFEDPDTHCYSITVARGQRMKVRLTDNPRDNVAVTIPTVGDMQTNFDFETKATRYTLEVNQMFPGPGSERYTLFVQVTGKES